MRLGINFAPKHDSPAQWAEMLAAEGFRAASFPVGYKTPVHVIDQYLAEAKAHDILIAEVGIWNSPFAPDPEVRARSREDALEKLRLAEYVKARCCVNVSGSVGEVWSWCYPGNYDEKLYVDNIEWIRYLLDTVKPVHTKYALEPMQWMLPDSPEQYAQFLQNLDRPGFAVHLDYINFINSAYEYTHQEELLERCFRLLGPHIVSCHIKDLVQQHVNSVMLQEVPIGTGSAHLASYLHHISTLEPDMPVLIEHLREFEAFCDAIRYLQKLEY